jgi:hypothetical protein
MIIRADHVAGTGLIAAGLAVFALSGDLSFGSLEFPGSAFLPEVLASIIIAMGALIVFGGAQSQPFRELGWSDLRHAGPVLAVSAAATVLYDRAGFVVTLVLMMSALLVVCERKRIVPAVVYSGTVVGLAYLLFTSLRAPIPIGPLGF